MKTFLYTFILSLTLIFFCCSSTQNVAEVGSEKISLKEFEQGYLQFLNLNYDEARTKTLDEKKIFLNSILDNRLIYLDGLDKKLDSSDFFQKKFSNAEKTLLARTLLEKKIINANLEDYYKLISSDYLAAHIVLKLSDNLEKEDSIKTYKRAEEIIEKLNNGENFSDLAKKYSTEVETKNNGGNLYYISAGQTLPEFEYTLFNLKEGEYTKTPLRTSLGLHIIKLISKVQHFDSVRVSQILIKDIVKPDGTIDSLTSFRTINSILDKISKGEDFAKLAEQNSQDEKSASNGGDLGYFKRGKYIPAFEHYAFTLKPGEVSGIIRSNIGWHILKVIDKVPISPLNTRYEEFKSKYLFSPYFKHAYQDYISNIRTKYNLQVLPDAVDFISHSIKDTSKMFIIIDLNKTFSENDRTKTIATFTGGNVTLNDFIGYISSTSSAATVALSRNNIINLLINSSDSPIMLMLAKQEGLDKSEEYLSALNEAKINLIVDIYNSSVIQPLVKVDENELKDYYEKNKFKFVSTDKGEPITKSFEEAKDEVIRNVKEIKFKDVTSFITAQLKQKFKISINDDVLSKAFSEHK